MSWVSNRNSDVGLSPRGSVHKQNQGVTHRLPYEIGDVTDLERHASQSDQSAFLPLDHCVNGAQAVRKSG